jgi:hypothetical protein
MGAVVPFAHIMLAAVATATYESLKDAMAIATAQAQVRWVGEAWGLCMLGICALDVMMCLYFPFLPTYYLIAQVSW